MVMERNLVKVGNQEIKKRYIGNKLIFEDLGDKSEPLSGEEIFFDNADDSVVHVGIDGRSVGGDNSSKNLSPDLRYWNTGNGATVGVNTATIPVGGSINLVIPWDGSTGQVRVGYDVVSGSSILVGFTYLGADKTTHIMDVNNLGSGNGYTHALTPGTRGTSYGYYTIDDKVKYVRVSISGSPSYVSEPFTIKNISVKSEGYEYEPPVLYPEHPSHIHSLNDFDVVSSVGGRNLVKNSDKPKKLNGRNEWGLISTHVYQMIERNEKNSTYTISIKMKGNGRETNLIEPYILGTYLMGRFNITDEYRVYTNTFKTYNSQYQPIHFYGKEIDSIEIEWIKIEKGSTATPYTPALEDITENDNHPLIDKINLSLDEPLRSIGDIKDRLFRDSDGLWKVERVLNEFAMTGEENILENGTEEYNGETGTARGFWLTIAPDDNFRDGVSSHMVFVRASWWGDKPEISGFDYSGGSLYPRIANTSLGVVSSDTYSQRHSKYVNYVRQQYNNGTPITFLYKRANPIIETLDQDLQDKLNNLRSFQDSNYVYAIINDKTDNLSENLKPTLHTTFKSKGWYDYYLKTLLK